MTSQKRIDKEFKIILTASIIIVFALLLLLIFNFGKIMHLPVIRDLSALVSLQKKIVKKYNWDLVTISINNNSLLIINFVNSPFRKLGRYEKEKFASEVADYAYSQYEKKESIERIRIVFGISKRFWIFYYNDFLDAYEFEYDAISKKWILKE